MHSFLVSTTTEMEHIFRQEILQHKNSQGNYVKTKMQIISSKTLQNYSVMIKKNNKRNKNICLKKNGLLLG